MLDWTAVEVDGATVERIQAGDLRLTVFPKGTKAIDRHGWEVARVSGEGKRAKAEVLAEGRSRMLNGARERALRTALSIAVTPAE